MYVIKCCMDYVRLCGACYAYVNVCVLCVFICVLCVCVGVCVWVGVGVWGASMPRTCARAKGSRTNLYFTFLLEFPQCFCMLPLHLLSALQVFFLQFVGYCRVCA